MEYQKIIYLLDSTLNQPSKFATKNWVEINYYSCGMHKANSQIKLKTSMLKPNVCDYKDVYILAKGTVPIINMAGEGNVSHNDKKMQFLKVVFHLLIA